MKLNKSEAIKAYEKYKSLLEKRNEINQDIKQLEAMLFQESFEDDSYVYLVIQAVCEVYNIDEDDLKSEYRIRHFVDARKSLALIVRDKVGWPFKRIGDLLNRDHASIVHYCNRAQDMIVFDPVFSGKFKAIQDKVKEYEEKT